MSLKHAAKHLAAHGRGPDTELVHMTKGEINGLQQLAKSQGGSLTINPHTGLAEAGFLSNMLPMIAGAAAMYFSGGTAAPLLGGLGMGLSSATTIGLGMGALQTARTGSLEKGLMAGLGAYGGAGLAGGLMGAGASQASNAIGASAEKAGEEAATSAATDHAAKQTAINAAGQSATNPAAIEAVAQRQAAFNAMPLETLQQSAREAAANAYAPTAAQTAAMNSPLSTGISGLTETAGRDAFGSHVAGMGSSVGKLGLAAAAPAIAGMMAPQNNVEAPAGDSTMPQRLKYNVGRPTDATGNPTTPAPDVPGYGGGMGQDFGRERNYFPTAGYQKITPEEAKQMRGYADGGMPTSAGPVERMSNQNAIGANTGYPGANINHAAYATPYQTPVSQNVVSGPQDVGVNSMTGEMNEFANGGIAYAAGGMSHLGDYSDGGRLLKGPGDGVSDSIPAVIGNKRPARLADGEFVVPARIVSELGNGSTEAGARKLYAMLDRVQAVRKKSIGKGKVAKNSRADNLLPA